MTWSFHGVQKDAATLLSLPYISRVRAWPRDRRYARTHTADRAQRATPVQPESQHHPLEVCAAQCARALSRAHTRTRRNTRGKSKPKPGQSVDALMWPPFYCLQHPEYLYICIQYTPRIALFLSLLFLYLSLCTNLSFDRCL